MEKEDIDLLESIIDKVLDEYRAKHTTLVDKVNSEKRHSMESKKGYVELISEISELKGLVRAAQILNLQKMNYMKLEIELSETTELIKQAIYSLMETDHELIKMYDKFFDDIKKINNKYPKSKDKPQQ